MKLLAIIPLCLLVVGCQSHRKPVMPVTPAVYRAEKARVSALWRQGKLTTEEANTRLYDLEDGVKDYCADHYCGN